jgi:hypothetical protein
MEATSSDRETFVMNTFFRDIVSGRATKEQGKDTGMAIVLLLLIGAVATHRTGYVTAAIIVHVVSMAVPAVFRPAAVVWFGLSHLLGTVMSKVVLGIVFFLVVTPVGVIRRLIGSDTLRLRAFKAGRSSVMTVRDHTYTAADLEHPY